MRILVTGSAGFIGRHVVAALVARGDEVGALDRASLAAASPAHCYYSCDLLDAAALARAIAEFAPEAVVHLAARTDIAETRDLSGYAANIGGVAHLMAAIGATPSVRRVVVTSTQLVCRIGHVPAGPTDYRPSTLYGASKVRTEEITRAADGAGREWCLVRPTTIWGPGMSAHYRHFLDLIRRGRYVHIGRRPLPKSYGYVENIAEQYCRLLDAPAAAIHRRTLYLADYQPIELSAWADAFQRAMGAPEIRRVPYPLAAVLARLGDGLNAIGLRQLPFNSFRLNNVITPYVFDLAETEAICGALPYSMEEGVRRTVAWLDWVSPASTGAAAMA